MAESVENPRWECRAESDFRMRVKMWLPNGVLIIEREDMAAQKPWKVRAYSYTQGDVPVLFPGHFELLHEAQEELEMWAKRNGWL